MKDKKYSLPDMIEIFKKSHQGSFDFSSYTPDPSFEKLMNQSCAFYFLIDFSRMKYIYLSAGVKNTLGYEREQWQTQGLDFAFNMLLEEDREVLRLVHERIMEEWQRHPKKERKDLRFSFDFRVRAANGQVVRLNQQSVFVEIDKEGNPLVDFSVCTDISNFKSEGPVTLHIKKKLIDGKDYEKHIVFESPEQEFTLSGREKQIMELLAEGLTSTEISKRLFISPHTVSTHRKNILKKAKCKSAVELLKFVKTNGSIRLRSH